MNPQLSANWKEAQRLHSEKVGIEADLLKLQEELRFLTDAVSKKITAKEQTEKALRDLQSATRQLVDSGDWVLKDAPVSPLAGVATGGQAAIISKTLNENTAWNWVKKGWKIVSNFFSNLRKPKEPSAPPASAPVSSTETVSSPAVATA